MNASILFPSLGIASLTLAGFTLIPTANAAQDCGKATKAATVAHYEKDIVETAVAAGQFGTLAAALRAADLIDTLKGEGPFTVFAPTDAAFAALPEGTVESLLEKENLGTLTNILTYHVVSGSVNAASVVKLDYATALNGQRLPIEVDKRKRVTVAGASVVTTDIECSNGIIHVIDTVMMPATSDIVETAVEAGQFETLAAALRAAELIEALKGEGPFTVFAPVDAAFAALPEGTLESLLEPANRDRLAAILKFHVVQGRVYSDQLKSGRVKTLQGSTLEIVVGEESVSIGGAGVVMADIETTNGVIHVIDTVLLP